MIGEGEGGGGGVGKDVNSIINTCFFFVYCSLLLFFVLAFLFIRGKTNKQKKNGQVLNKPQMRLLPISSNGVFHTTIRFHMNPQ